MERVYGAKYDRSLDTAEIAKRIRAEIKADQKAGKLPLGKYSVRIERFAGGSSIDIEVRELNVSWPILNPDRVRFEQKYPHQCPTLPVYSRPAHDLLARLAGYPAAYNHNGSDLMTDYHDVNFYGGVRFGWELERAERTRIQAEPQRCPTPTTWVDPRNGTEIEVCGCGDLNDRTGPLCLGWVPSPAAPAAPADCDPRRATFERWLSDGRSWIGVFENHDLGSRDVGRRVAFCFDVSQDAQGEIGKTRAPDHRDIGLGWRYILIAKCVTVEDALAKMDENR